MAVSFGLAIVLATAISAAGAGLFVSSQFGDEVIRYNLAGQGRILAVLHDPQGLALDASGILYVGSFEDSTVYQVSPKGKTRVFISGGLVGNVTSLAFDGSGNLYLGRTNHPPSPGITKVAPDGTATVFATGLEPNGLTFDTAGNLFATDDRTGVIYRFAPDGSRTTFATGFLRAEFLAFDTAGNLFVSDILGGIVYKIASDGTESTFATVETPVGLAFDSEGNLFVADYDPGTILKFAPDGTRSTFASGLVSPLDIVFQP